MLNLTKLCSPSKSQLVVTLPPASQWKKFLYPELFTIKRGGGVTTKEAKMEENAGTTPLAGAAKDGNGITGFTSFEPTFPANVITVGNSGNGGAGLAFYQPIPFCSCGTINVLFPKFELNPSIAMFLVAIISQEHYRYNHGLGWSIARMNESTISLPVDNNGQPDWQLMEDYINSLPYSKYL